MLCDAVCCELQRTIVLSPHWTFSPLGGTSVAAVRAVALLAARVASAEGHIRNVLLASVRAGAGVCAPLAADTSHHAAGIAAAGSLVAMRPRADADGATTHRATFDIDGAERRHLNHHR